MFVLSILVVLLSELDCSAGVKSPERPVVPNVTALSSTEIRITWCRVNSNKVEIDHYELYIDTELEYSGLDVMYIAKRLKTWSWYEVKLRACGFSPGSCSPFSRPALVKTLRDGDNTTTVIQSGVTIFKVIVVPTYMFILGMIAGVLAISFVLIWRYLQCADLSGGSAFELPQYKTAATKDELDALLKHQPPASGNNLSSSLESMPNLTKASLVDSVESHYLEILPSGETVNQQNSFVITDFLSPSLYLMNSACDEQDLLAEGQVTLHVASEQFDTAHEQYTQIANLKDGVSSLKDYEDKQHKQGLQSDSTDKNHRKDNERTESLSNSTLSNKYLTTPLFYRCTEQTVECLDASNKGIPLSQSSSLMQALISDSHSDKEVMTGLKRHSSFGMVVAIDNSNIYIGAQECASMVNASDRKRHVRVKLQNLVKILEKERTKTRGFAGGSSPPATEHVWEVYRRLGYIVDLEDRRGKDEQRVDEGLHLWIYKALCELPPGVLVLATGDGMKGKSECDTSFPGCAMTALDRGWTVEVYSWKHSLSSEWIKLAKKHPDTLTINYLDKYVNYITFVDGKNGRKCSSLPSEASVFQR